MGHMYRLWWMLVIAGISIVFWVVMHSTMPLTTITPQSLPNGARLTPAPCWFDIASQPSVQCGWLTTAPPANLAKPSASFQIPIVLIPYTGKQRELDPVVYLGQSISDNWQYDHDLLNADWLLKIRKHIDFKRDIILIGRRGHGLSKPNFYCPEYQQWQTERLTNASTMETNAQLYRQATELCHLHLSAQDLPLSAIGAEHSAQDVHDVLTLLGYTQWNAWATFYGTRLAFELQRLYPQQMRSMTVDSVYPPGEHLLQEWPLLLQTSLERLFDYCAGDEQCQRENGNVRDIYNSIMQQLNHAPMAIDVSDLKIGNLQTIRLTNEILLAILFDVQSSSNTLRTLPALLKNLHENQLDNFKLYLKHYLEHQYNLAAQVPSFWMDECHDNPPTVFTNAQLTNTNTELRTYLAPEYDVCDIWNKTNEPSPLAIPEHITTPALILAGDDDPITPVTWAIKTAGEYFAPKQAYLFRFSTIAHQVMVNKPCTIDLFVNFLNTPDERPQADCRFDAAITPLSLER